MPQPHFREVTGDIIPSDQLTILRAKDFTRLIEAGATPYATVVECRRTAPAREAVVIDLCPTVPQRPKVRIRRLERVSVEFDQADGRYPDIRALREDFPRERVMHLNGGIPVDEPPSLCLFVEPWVDVRLRLTANELLFRLQNWFEDTATGKLHRDDQPLEPTFLAKSHLLIIGEDFIDRLSNGNPALDLDVINVPERLIFIERGRGRISDGAAARFCVLAVTSEPHDHSYSCGAPQNLWQLHCQLEPTGIDLLKTLQSRFVSMGGKLDHYDQLLILVLLLRQRTENAKPEPELVAFLCPRPDQKITGLQWLRSAVGYSSTGSVDPTRKGESVPVAYLSVRHELSAAAASRYSGLESIQGSFVAIGGGAIGSQFLMTAVRSGLVRCTVIDDDILLPHNLVRHSLPGRWIGQNKVKGLAEEANSILDSPSVQSIMADVLSPGQQQVAVEEVLKAADAIIDLSASIAVARHLTCDVEGAGRRCSAFVSPSGNDLIFLGENTERTLRLDTVEVQYYREIAQNLKLQGHLRGGEVVGSCRDITSRVPQHLMGIHAAQAERIFRSWYSSADALAMVLRADETSFGFEQVSLPLGAPVQVGVLGGWTIVTDAIFLNTLSEQRKAALPNETGGVLLAHMDAQRRTLYVCHQIPAPPDSERQPTVYIRGCQGLAKEYDRIREETLNGLVYIGEWHSHPDGYACSPSQEDLLAGAWLAEQTLWTSLPGLMLILGEHQQTCWMLCQQVTTAPILLSSAWGETAS